VEACKETGMTTDEEVIALLNKEMDKALDEIKRNPRFKKAMKRTIEALDGKMDILLHSDFNGLEGIVGDEPVHILSEDDFLRRGRSLNK
jgi:hypothetical protein